MKLLNQLITPKTMKWISLGVLILSIIPLIIIGTYSYPAADDYSFCLYGMRAWNETHNIFLVIWGGMVRAYEFWRDWQGYYASNFAMAMSPAIFGPKAYCIVTPLILTFLFVGVSVFFRRILHKLMGISSDITWTVIFLFLFIVVQCMPKSARAEALFWYNGASTYIFLGSLSLIFYSLLLALYEKSTRLKVILVSLLGLIVGGSNLITALNVAFVLGIMWTILLVSKRIGRARALILPSVFFYIGFILNVAAPGNAIRGIDSGMPPIKSILISLEQFFTVIIDTWISWPILLFLILLIPLFWKGLEKTKFNFRFPVIAVILGYIVVAALMTPSLFARSNFAAGRIVASIFISFMLIAVLLEAYLVGWVRNQYELRLKENEIETCENNEAANFSKQKEIFGHNTVYMIAAVLCCFVFAVGLTVVPNRDYFTCTEAVEELASGQAQAFSESMSERERIYEETAALPKGERHAYIRPLKAEPSLLYVTDMRGSDAEWIERVMCKALELDSITMLEE